MNTNNRTKTIFGLILLLILIGLSGYYFLFTKGNEKEAGSKEGEAPVTFTIGNGNIDLNEESSPSNQNTATSTIDSGKITTGSGTIPKLRKISQNPVAGMSSRNVLQEKDKKILVRFIEKATGHIYETAADSWTLERISNTTIPKIHDALWSKNPNSLYIRSIVDETEEIGTFFATLKPVVQEKSEPKGAQESSDSSPEELKEDFVVEGTYLPKNIEDIEIGNDGRKIFYFAEKNDLGTGIVSDLNGTNGKEIWSSALSELEINWPKDDTLTLTTKPSASVGGFMYFLNRNTLKSQKMLGGVLGLTTLTSPDISSVLYGEGQNGRYNLKLYDIKGKKTETISLSTFPEKCLWSKKDVNIIYCAVPKNFPQGSYPDSWYQGVVSLDDEIWKIDVGTKVNKLLAKPEELTGETVDGIKLSLSPDEEFLFFVNKKDNSLWSLKLIDDRGVPAGVGGE